MQLQTNNQNENDRQLLRELSSMYVELQRKFEAQRQMLNQVSKMYMDEKNKDTAQSEEMKIIQWIKDMFDYSPPNRRNQLASKAKPTTTYNTFKNRVWVDTTIELCIDLEIMYKSRQGTLWARCSRGEAVFKIQDYFNDKRQKIIDI